MSKHPNEDWQDQATRMADRLVSERESWLWWQEYRAAYARAAGLDDDIPTPPTVELQAFLTSLDEKVLKLRSKARSA